jgi:hypothetical protein
MCAHHVSRSEERAGQRRRQLMLAALDDQLCSPETPEVKHHYERLRGLGHSDADVRELMATVLAFYFWHTMRKDDYTYDDYLAELSKLPEIDWQDDDAPDNNQRA